MSRTDTLAGWIALLTIIGTWGCGDSIEPTPDGTLTVDWEITPRSCGESGVEKLQIDLEYEEGTVTETFPCTDRGATLEGLEPANYTLNLWGLDAEGDATFGAGPHELTVPGGHHTEAPPMQLTAQPGDLRVTWRFDNGGVCGANEVETVDLALYDTDDYRIRQRTIDCTNGRRHLREVPPGEYLVELRGRSAESMFIGATEVRVRRGKSSGVEVVLVYDDGSDPDK